MKIIFLQASFISLALCGPSFAGHVGFPQKKNDDALPNEATSLRILFQNNLNASDTNHVGTVLLDPMTYEAGEDTCARIGESLIKFETLLEYKDDFLHIFSYLDYEAQKGRKPQSSEYFIFGGTVSQDISHKTFSFTPRHTRKFSYQLPVLCTQTGDTTTVVEGTEETDVKELAVTSNGNTFIGTRDRKSFRFLGIPYADPPKRFEYAEMYSQVGQTIQSKSYGSRCAQPFGGGGEDCLFLNIYTPYIPKRGSMENLKPVMFWIHGGGYTGGAGSDAGMDGGNLASREDIVLVSINYRLSTPGFFAVPGTNIRGNFGIADQILALEWTIQNIPNFGGDPDRITIVGESAGAASVRVLLGSPPALGKFHGGIAMSNLGSGVGLGLESDYATTYSDYLTIENSYAIAGEQIFAEAGCTTASDLADKIDCLKSVPANELVSLSTVARYVVQDGHFVNSTQLNLIQKNHGTAYVPVIFGICANDGASSIPYPPPASITSEQEGLEYCLGISSEWAQKITQSGLFPYHDTGNLTLDTFNVSQRVATDIQFRCINQATMYAGSQTDVFPRAYYYQIQRTEGGYDPNGLGGPPVTPGYPNGNPNLPYFRLHASDVPWLFGGPITLRDAADLYSLQLVSGQFAEFARSGQPNPSLDYLRARGYEHTLKAIREAGPWREVRDRTGPIQFLDYPGRPAPFKDMAQCEWLNYPIDYYLEQ